MNDRHMHSDAHGLIQTSENPRVKRAFFNLSQNGKRKGPLPTESE
jgi:hypothetical protein